MKAKALNVRDDGMNGLERNRANHLTILKAAGEILEWGFHRWKINLGPGAWYTPDFDLILPDGQIVFEETKGFMREAANVRIKTVAAKHPRYVFRVVRWKDKRWQIETI